MARRTLPLSALLGLRVVNRQGEDLGDIAEIMLDTESGTIAYAALRVPHMLGLREHLFALRWSSIQVDLDAGQVVVDLSRERLRNSPGFDRSHWPDHGDGLPD